MDLEVPFRREGFSAHIAHVSLDLVVHTAHVLLQIFICVSSVRAQVALKSPQRFFLHFEIHRVSQLWAVESLTACGLLPRFCVCDNVENLIDSIDTNH